MDYMTISEAAEKWGISRRRVQTLCTEGRIAGVVRFGHCWVIPKEAEKPSDARIKNGNYVGVSSKYKKADSTAPTNTDILTADDWHNNR